MRNILIILVISSFSIFTACKDKCLVKLQVTATYTTVMNNTTTTVNSVTLPSYYGLITSVTASTDQYNQTYYSCKIVFVTVTQDQYGAVNSFSRLNSNGTAYIYDSSSGANAMMWVNNQHCNVVTDLTIESDGTISCGGLNLVP